MRVVAGEARGRRLQAPTGRSLRPTSDRVREAIFDILASLASSVSFPLQGALVADVFAGTGALGIEALSRGAARVTFVDNDRAAVATIRANLDRTGLGGRRAQVVRAEALRWLASAGPHDLVLCDPPYAFGAWTSLLSPMAGVARLAVLETARPVALGEEWEALRVKEYGGTVVTVARPAVAPAPHADRKGDT